MRVSHPFLAPILAVLALLCGCSHHDAPPKNVILVSIDTLRRDHLHAYGYPRPTSPFLDSIAAAGALFDQAIAQAPWTAPSHASMLSSLYPSVLGVGRFEDPGRIADDVDMLAETLQAAGFRTHAITAGGFMASRVGFDQGFEVYDDAGLNMTETIAKAKDWLSGIHEDERFFLFLHTYDVHKYKPEPEWLARFSQGYDGPLLDEERVADLVQNHDQAERAAALADADRQYVIDLYDASIAATDAQLAAFWNDLKASGRADDTLLVVTADHGEEFWEHGGTGHGFTLFDENLRVPLILAHRSIAARRVADQVRLLDVAPTIVDLLGVSAPASWQGESLRSFLAGHPRPLIAYSEHAHRPLKSVRTPDAKLIVGLDEPRRSYFDLAADPRETTNRIASAPPQLLESMRKSATLWIRSGFAESRFRSTSGVEFDADERAQIAALGYAGSGGPEAPDPDLAVWLNLLGAP